MSDIFGRTVMRIGPIAIERVLPGEHDGTLDPRDYGFGVIRTEFDPREMALGAADLIRRVRAEYGVYSPRSDDLLNQQPYDPQPARLLAAKHEALQYPYTCQFGKAALTIDEGVFCPTLTKVSPFLLTHIDFRPNETVLDAFSGSGAFGINAATRGADVVAFDSSGVAVECAQKNAERNEVTEKVDVRHGDLQETLDTDETFDLIIANPPLIPMEPTTPFETALFDPDLQTTKGLIAALPKLLAKRGRCYLTTSDVIDRNDYKVDVPQLCSDNNLAFRSVAQLHLPYESYRVHKITHKTATSWISPILKKTIEYLR